MLMLKRGIMSNTKEISTESDSDQSDDDFVNIYMAPGDVEAKIVNGLMTADLCNYDVISHFPNFANNLQVIRMSTNELEDIPGENSKIPKSFCQMKCLKELFLYGDAVRRGAGLSSLPPDFGKLKTLEVLNLEHNCFSNFPEQICNLFNLKKLYLNGCGLTYISSRIKYLLNLLEADLSDNDFSSGLCKELFDLPRLKDLYLMNCELSELPEEIGNLEVLEGLRLNDNKLTEFPEPLYTMKHLKKLAATKNRISKLSPKIIGLESLKVLLLGENNLTFLPNEISKLQYLQVLNVFGNRLTCLPDTFIDLDPSSKIIIHGNNYLQKPPLGICSKGIDSIKGFFTSMSKNDKIHSNRIKIVMLGEAGAGKTFLTHALVNCKALETELNDSTIGVEMHHCAFGEDGYRLEACIVDCAGQRSYQLTHPFFLSEEALHVIVVNLTTYQATKEAFEMYVEDWINWITARLWKPRIMIVATHRDEVTEDDVKLKCKDILTRIENHEKREIRRLQSQIKDASKKVSPKEDRESARVKEENLKWLVANRPIISSRVLIGENPELEKGTCLNLVAVASTDELKGMILLRKEICRVARCKTASSCSREDALFPLVGTDLPTSWVNLEQSIREYRKNLNDSDVPCMTKEQFEKFAKEKAGLEGSEVVSGLNYLDSGGEIKFYDSNYNIPKTQYSVFLDLPWLCKLVKLLFRHDYEQKDAIEFKEEYSDFGMEKVKFENHLTQLKDNGRLSMSLLRCIWEELHLNNEEFDNMIKSLVTFGLACEIPSLEDEMFIPWFLHSELDPEHKQEIFPDIPASSDQEELCLKFAIVGYLPAGLFDRLCVRCYALGIDVMTWKNSMIIYKDDIQIYLKVVESVITVTGRTNPEKMKMLWIAILGIVKELRYLLSEWQRIVYNTYTVCPHCIKKKYKDPYHFECKWWKGVEPLSKRCRKSKKHVIDVNQLVPPKELLAGLDRPAIPINILVSSALLRELSTRMPTHWEILGTFLGVSNDRINAIKVNNTGNVNEQAYTMLSAWQELKGREATIQALVEALRRSEREDLVNFVLT